MPEDMRYSADDFDNDEEVSLSEDIEANDLYDIHDMEKAVDLELAQIEEDSDEADSLSAESDFDPYRSIKIVDTAGIRKQSHVRGFIEEQSVYRSLKAISECDLVIYMIDATKGITHQDRRLCDIALEKGKSIIICLNKVDLILRSC